MIEQTKTRPQWTLVLKMENQLKTFPFSQRLNLVEEGKWFLSVNFFEATNSVFNKTIENNSFLITIEGLREEVQKLLTNYKNYYRLDLKMILNRMLKNLEKEEIK